MHPRIGFAKEFGYPALLCFLAAHVPKAIILANTHLIPTFFAAHPHVQQFCLYAADSWRFFLIIVVCFILVAGAHQQRELYHLRKGVSG